jgi:hypothetical protein
MVPCFYRPVRASRCVLGLGLGLWCALSAAADVPIDAAAPALHFNSVFSHYRGFSEQDLAPWRDTNRTVQAIGGWRVYAREARQAEPGREDEGKTPAPADHTMHGTHGSQP